MREIKYRAWLTYEKRMIEWENLHLETFKDDETGKVSFMLWVGDDEDDNFGSACGESCFKLLQYTGLKDRNGREIYEGDVVGYKWEAVRNELLVVEWSFSDGAYSFGGIRTDYAVKFGEVIGNIYENPELLEVAE